MNRPLKSLLFFVVATLVTAMPLQAVDYLWNVVGPSDTSIGTNWSPNMPGGLAGIVNGDWLYVNNGGIADITTDIGTTTNMPDYFYVARGASTSGTVVQTAGTVRLGGGLRGIGRDGGNGTYDMQGGTVLLNQRGLNSTSLLVGSGGGSVGLLKMSGSATITGLQDAALIGDSGDGTITMKDTATLNLGELMIGNNVTGVGHVNVTGGTLNLRTSSDWSWYGYEATLDLGRDSGHGTMTVTNAILDITGRTNIGNGSASLTSPAAQGDLTLSGNTVMQTHPGTMRNYGWLWTDGGDVYVGCNEWDNGVNARGPATLTQIGGVGSVTVNDTASMIVQGVLQIGVNGGTGTFTQTGGRVVAGDFWVGNAGNIGVAIATTTGTANISGGTFVSRGWFSIGGSQEGGVGTMTVSGTADVTVFGYNYIGRQNSHGVFNQNGGATFVRSGTIMTEDNEGTHPNNYAELNLNGGVYSTPWVQVGWNTGAYSNAVINLNGGTMRAYDSWDNDNFINPFGSTNTNIYVKSGGAVFDTYGANIGVQLPFQHSIDPLEPAIDGGFTKIGYGSFTLSAAGNNYTGPTRVQVGQLTLADTATFTAAAPNEIQVSTGAALASNGNSATFNANLTFSNRSAFLAGVDGALNFGVMTVNNVNAAAPGDKVLVGFNGSNEADVAAWQAGIGSLPVLNYTTEGPNVPTFLPVVDSVGIYDINLVTTATSVGIKYDDNSASRGWISGNWNTGTWTEGAAPNATTARAWFQTAGTLQLDGPATVSSLLFNSAGTTITSDGASRLTLNSSIAGNAQIQVLSGAHVIDPDINMAAGDPIITIAGSASLTLNGVLRDMTTGVPAGITLVGKGIGTTEVPTNATLVLNGANTFTGPIVMTGSGGRLEVNTITNTTTANSLGMSGPAPSNLVLGGFLAYTGATNASTDRGMTLGGPTWGNLIGVDVQQNVNLTFNGTIATGSLNAFRKEGIGTLTFANAGLNQLSDGDFQVGNGAVVFENGTYSRVRVNIGFQNGYGDFFVGDTAGQDASITIKNGAKLLGETSDLNLGRWGANGTITMGANASDTTYFGAGASYIGIDGGNGKFILKGNATYASVNFLDVACGGVGSVGAVELHDNAKATFDGWLGVGRDTPGNVGTLTLDGHSSIYVRDWTNLGHVSTGTVTIKDHATARFDGEFDMGVYTDAADVAGKGYLNLEGDSKTQIDGQIVVGYQGEGHVVVKDNATLQIGSNILVGYNYGNGNLADRAIGDITVSGNGSITHVAGSWRTNIYIGHFGGTGKWNQEGGSASTTSMVILADSDGSTSPGNGTLNLDGGTFAAPGFRNGWDSSRSGTAVINFNGGILKADGDGDTSAADGGLITAGNNEFFSNRYGGTLTLNIKAGSAIIDTNGHYVKVTVPFTDAALTGGSLAKLGAGTLDILATGNTYIGDTIVDGGTMNIPAINTPAAMVYVATGATLNASSIVADSLYIGGAPIMPAAAAATAVPEPSTLVLLVLAGLACAGAYLRRK